MTSGLTRYFVFTTARRMTTTAGNRGIVVSNEQRCETSRAITENQTVCGSTVYEDNRMVRVRQIRELLFRFCRKIVSRTVEVSERFNKSRSREM
jgi:hypothetical protein